MPWHLCFLVFCLVPCLASTPGGSYQEPGGAFPALAATRSEPGEVDQLGDLTVFRFGPSTNDKWIIWGHDIYGVDSGRTKEYCEKMNTELGVTCILPDFFKGAGGW